MRGAIPILPHTSLWCTYLSKVYVFVARYLVKHRDNSRINFLRKQVDGVRYYFFSFVLLLVI